MKYRINQKGFMHLTSMLIIVAVVAIVGFVGARVISQSKAATSPLGNGLVILNSQGDTWGNKMGLVNKFFWPQDTKCDRSNTEASQMHGGVAGNEGKKVSYLLGKTVNGTPKILLCKAPIDRPQTAEVVGAVVDGTMQSYEENPAIEFFKNPIISPNDKLALEIRLSGQTKSDYYLSNNSGISKLKSFGQSIGYQWKAASDTNILTYRAVHPFNKCNYDISKDSSDCVETTLPKETVQVFMPRSNNYIIYATRATVNGKVVGSIYKADLNGGNKKLLKENVEALRILAISPSETKVLYNGSYKARLLTISDSSTEVISDAQTFGIWQPVPPTVSP